MLIINGENCLICVHMFHAFIAGPPVRPKAPMVELSHRPHIIWRAPNHGGMPINEYWLAAR